VEWRERMSYAQKFANVDDIVGCTEQEISEIQQKQGINRLPTVYEEIMKIMGRKAGRFFTSEGFFYQAHIYLNMKDTANDIILRSDSEFKLPLDAFVFLWHPNYIFCYFTTETVQDDPTVYRFVEGDKQPIEIGTFTKLLENEFRFFKSQI
jgi:hypothetical protein